MAGSVKLHKIIMKNKFHSLILWALNNLYSTPKRSNRHYLRRLSKDRRRIHNKHFD
jgi:hypothetical protein